MDGPVGFYPHHPTSLRSDLDRYIGRSRLGLDPGLILHPQRELSRTGPLLGDLYRSLDVSGDVIVVSMHDGDAAVTMQESVETPLGDVPVDDMGVSFLTGHEGFIEDARTFSGLPGPFITAIMLQATGWDGALIPVALPRSGEIDPAPLLDLVDDTTVCLTADLTTGTSQDSVRRQDRELIAGLEDGQVPDGLSVPDRAGLELALRMGRFDGLRRFGHEVLDTDAGYTGVGAFCSDPPV